MSEDTVEEFLSTIYHTLRATRRRYVVQVLNESEETVVSVRSLSREIAAREHGVPHSRATGEPYRNAYNALTQTHLPTLSEAGIIIYDNDRQIVSAGQYLDLAVLLTAMTRPAVVLFHEQASAESSLTDSGHSTTD